MGKNHSNFNTDGLMTFGEDQLGSKTQGSVPMVEQVAPLKDVSKVLSVSDSFASDNSSSHDEAD